MAKPVTGWIGYNPDTDRPTAKIGTGEVDLLVEGDGGAAHAATHQNGGSDEISVAGLSGELADPQRADVIVESSGPTDLAVGAVATGQLVRRVGSTAVGMSPLVHFASPPLSPDALDVEFDDAALPGAFTLWNYSGASAVAVTPATNPDIFSVPGGNPRLGANMARRPSWLCVQAPTSNAYLYTQPVTLTTGMTISTRLFTTANHSTATNNRGLMMLAVAKDNGGAPHVNGAGSLYSYVFLGWEPDGGVFQLECLTGVNNAASVSRGTGLDLDSTMLTPDFELVLHLRSGANALWQVWVKGSSVTYYIGEFNLGTNNGLEIGDDVHIGWAFVGNSSIDVGNGMGTPVSGADYLRFDTDFLP